MKFENSEYTFETTGRKVYCNGGLISVSGDVTFGGYDMEFVERSELTPEEARELADYMIQEWENFAKGPMT